VDLSQYNQGTLISGWAVTARGILPQDVRDEDEYLTNLNAVMAEERDKFLAALSVRLPHIEFRVEQS
jgi:hypothetical protein